MNGDTTAVRRRLRRQIKDSEALRPRTLPLAVLASVVGTMLASAYGTGRTGALLSAATGPLITALFTTRGRMPARWAGIVLVTCVAVALTVTGFTVPELVLGGRSLLADRSGTFVPTEGGGSSAASPSPSLPTPARTPALETSATALACDGTPVGGAGRCPALTVRSVGTADLRVTGVAVEGGPAGEFRATAACPGPLPRGASCSIAVEFHPSGAGPRQAVLVVHQNLPGPATRVTLHGTGQDQGGSSPGPDPSGPGGGSAPAPSGGAGGTPAAAG